MEPKVICVNEYDKQGKQRAQQDRIYDNKSIATALCVGLSGRYNIIDEQNRTIKADIIGTIQTDGSSPKHNNRVLEGNFDPDKPHEIIEVLKGGKKVGAILQDGYIYYVRKLTPRECLRLMGWKDEQIDKIIACGMSNTQMYKQAGNGIVVNTLEAIFAEPFADREVYDSNYVIANQISF